MTIPQALFVEPDDDAGAQTADRYDWQALVAAADFIGAVASSSSGCLNLSADICLICEHHEDYVLCIESTVQLVSVKHRDLSQGHWTFAKIFGDGGVAHLFERWFAFAETPQVRLVTNAELGPGDAANFRALCVYLRECPIGPLASKQSTLLSSAAKRILKEIAQDRVRSDWTDDGTNPTWSLQGCVRRFLAALIFDCARPHRQILPAAAIGMYVSPFLDAIGHRKAVANSFWEAIGSLFRQRMRGRLDYATESLSSVIGKIHELSVGDDDLTVQIRRRTITIKDLADLLSIAEKVAITPVHRHYDIAPTRLAIKLLNGGCKETTAHAAEAVAARWRSHESAIALSEVGVAAELQRVKAKALVVAADIHESLADNTPGGKDYGPEMWRQLTLRLEPEIFEGGLFAIDSDLALGLACDLASQCQVWFSSGFNIDEARSAFPTRFIEAGALRAE